MSARKLAEIVVNGEYEVKPYGKTSYYVLGKRLGAKTAAKDLWGVIKDDLKEKLTKEEYYDVQDYCLESESSQELIDAISREIKKVQQKKQEEAFGSLNMEISYKFGKQVPVRDITTNEKAIFDTKKNEISILNYETWEDKLTPEQREAFFQANGKEMCGLLTFNPLSLQSSQVVRFQDQDIYEFNLYVPPSWRKIQKANADISLWVKFFHHFIPTEEARKYLFSWIVEMMEGRNQTILCLIGAPGTGKNLTADLLNAFVGDHNALFHSLSFFMSSFDGELRHKQLVVFDEVPLNKAKTKERLKRISNDTITHEFKGKNVGQSEKNHTNMVIMNNNPIDNELVFDDRRFSCLPITNTPLLDVMSEEEVAALYESMKDVDTLWTLFDYCKANSAGDNFSRNVPYKCDWFHTLCKISLPQWAQFTIDYLAIMDHDTIEIVALKMFFEENSSSSMWPGTGKFEHFLETFKDSKGRQIGQVEKNNNRFYVTRNKATKITVEETDTTGEENDPFDI